jgi:NAD(P)-dependent dehydrogenase (short-subunit alcohol dehydrogenase family)
VSELRGGLVSGKVGLVTGAAGGIGRGVAIELAREGAWVLVSDLASARAGGEETVRLVKEAGGEAEFAVCDVTSAEDCEALVARVVDQHGGSTLR